VNASDVPQLKNEAPLEVLEAATSAYQGLSINVDPAKSSSALASSPDLRHASQLAINRAATNDVVYGGTNVADCPPLPTISPFRPDNVKCSEYDPDAARKIIEESGATMPVPIEIMYPSRPDAQKTVEVIQQMANEAGFDVTLKPLEFLSALEAGRAGDFEASLIGWSGRTDPDGNSNDPLTPAGGRHLSPQRAPRRDLPTSDATAAIDQS